MSEVFNCIIDIFPKKSQPKILLREVSESSQKEPVPIVFTRIYFGFLIPKYEQLISLNYHCMR